MVKAVHSNNIEVVNKIISGGFPIDEPFVDHSKQTILMYVCKLKEKESSAEMCAAILALSP